MEFAEAVRRRRMVRHFADEPVARPVLERIAAAAQRTPSAGFSQGQRLVVVTDPARRRAVAEAVEEEEYVAAGFDPWLSRCAAQFIPCVSEQVYQTATASRTSSTTRETRSSGRRPTGGWTSAAR